MVGVFCALDMVLFYVFFEGGLIPMFIIIGVWGGKRRVYASFKFFLYTLLGSVLMLLAMMAMYWGRRHHLDPRPAGARLPGLDADLAMARLLRLLRGGRCPMWPVHTWLPDAHVEAPTARFGHPCRHPVEARRLRPDPLLARHVSRWPRRSSPVFVFTLSVIAIIYTSLVAPGAGRHQEADRLFLRRPHGAM